MASVPTLIPTSAPTFEPTMPTAPTFTPTKVPTAPPTLLPTPSPTFSPTLAPSGVPSFVPTPRPSFAPTRFTFAPSNANDPLGSNGVANPGYIAAFSVGAVLVFASLWFVWFVFWYMVSGVFFFCFEGSIFPHPKYLFQTALARQGPTHVL